MEVNKIYKGDCLEVMPQRIESNSIDLVLCDLPYDVKI
jgi:DNA modification methylase